MTNIADNLHIGTASTGIAPLASGGFGFGPVARIYIYDNVPLTLNASAYAASQSPGAAALILSAGTGVTKGKAPNGSTIYTTDVPRTITLTSGGNDSGITFLVSGYDFYGSAMSERITGVSGSTATGKKAFMSVASIVPSAAVASTITAGTSDVFGMPVAIVDAGYVINAKWNNTITADAGTFVIADNTSPATTTTGDVRGTYKPSANASNGARRLVVSIALSSLNIGTTQTVVGVLGQPQV